MGSGLAQERAPERQVTRNEGRYNTQSPGNMPGRGFRTPL